MQGSLPLITTLAVAFALALILGFFAVRIKLPALVGYLLAGVLIGPFTPGFVAHAQTAKELAEIGVMLLMFGVGLNFSLNDLLAVRTIAVPGALLQITVATLLGAGIAAAWGFGSGESLIFGLALSVASTVVLLRALETQGLLDSLNGRIAIGWLVVEDLVMVLVLVLLPPLTIWFGAKTSDHLGGLLETLGTTILKISAFIALIIVAGRKVFPKILWQVARVGSRELFTLCAVVMAISVAFIAAKLFGVSFALGAFFAGMMMRESELSHRVAEELLPLRDAFAVLFFVSVGMLFNPSILVKEPLHILAVVSIIILGKSLAAAALVLALRYPLNTALTVSASLAQIGEFSFILVGLGTNLGLLSFKGQNLILAGALISIAANPFIFKLINVCLIWFKDHPRFAKKLEKSTDALKKIILTSQKSSLTKQIVLVGYGQVGSRVGEAFFKHGIPFVVIDKNRELTERLSALGVITVTGDATESAILVQAHAAYASILVIAVAADTFNLRQMIKIARMLNSKIEIIIRTHNEEEINLLQGEPIKKIFFSEAELAKNMHRYILKRYRELEKHRKIQ